MKKRYIFGIISTLAVCSLALTGCTNRSKQATESASQVNQNFKTPTAVTVLGSIDDKSFNQSAWEGLQQWGQSKNITKGVGGFNYAAATQDSDLTSQINNLIKNKYQMIFGVGYRLSKSIGDAAKQNPNTNFAIVDDVISDQSNVASLTFKDEQAAYLAGVSAALSTKTNKIGFIGGVQGEVLGKFEKGYRAGAQSVNPDISIDVKYAGSFSRADLGKSMATAMYNTGADVIYQLAGETGTGVFSVAKDSAKSGNKVWVIGADRDQTDEGQYSGGNVTLTSSIKNLSSVIKDVADKNANGEFPGGKHTIYGLNEDGVDLVKGQLSDNTWAKVDQAKKDIMSGKITI